MDVILIPGFWLDASSWDAVIPAIREAGHEPRPLTLPGLESAASPRSDIGLEDHVDAVVAAIDAADGPVVLVGHSGGGAIAYDAADRRVDQVARIIYVDSGPLSEGAAINEELPAEGGEIPLPDWSAFEDAELAGFDEGGLAAFRARAVPQPLRVATDRRVLRDARRRDIPATVISSTMSAALIHELAAGGHPFMAEFATLSDAVIVELPTGHWPQLTRGAELGDAIAAALPAS
ncbi:alpha/beta fold hydrolase [Homoserinibacter sp. YIM 151385]|uniref:alpha/beta fold hydrolase n=1 Tax=Homoserinibacter sp. YIM 151385 TaxID=2985506 RepID=UPI0022F10B94|nr:alpha/beta hydrolase [Homoserinibacter sp. YIM 151385]WBU37035.1 alpha/beta hydrolase [Homoserinibacter sp. YIM 151385]